MKRKITTVFFAIAITVLFGGLLLLIVPSEPRQNEELDRIIKNTPPVEAYIITHIVDPNSYQCHVEGGYADDSVTSICPPGCLMASCFRLLKKKNRPKENIRYSG